MGRFVDQVRRGKIRQPTQTGFTPELWHQGYETIPERDDTDLDLFNAGLVFDRILTALRQELSKGRFQFATRTDRLVATCAFINHEVAALERKRLWQPPITKKNATVLISDLINFKLTLRSGVQITPDEVLTTVIDAAVLPLDEALQAREEGEPLSAETMTSMGLAFMVANLYCVAAALWSSCVWAENLAEQVQPGLIAVKRRDPCAARRLAVSEHRYQNYLCQSAQHASRIWRHQLSILGKKALTAEKGVTKFDARATRNPFVVGNLDQHRKRNIPFGIASWIVANEDYLQPFIRLPLPAAEVLSIELLHKIWQVLGTLVRAALARVPHNPGDLSWFLSHAVRVTRDQISMVLARSLGLDRTVIDVALQFLTYQRRSDGLWQKPLIAVSAEEFVIASGPLLYGNMLRIAERWLQQGDFDLKKRGPIFEKLARERVMEYLQSSSLLTDISVAPGRVLVGPHREEIDLLIRIGQLVLVGEAKCQLFPVDDIEKYRFQERLREGAAQAKRKAEAVRNYPDDVQTAIGPYDTQKIQVVPFVLSNCVWGSGYSVDGVGVADLLYLGTLFRDGGLRTMVVMRRAQEEVSGSFIRYYTNQAEAERRIPDLLIRQPVVQVFEKLTQKRSRPMPVALDGTKIIVEYYSVSTDSNQFDVGAPEPQVIRR
jgi:hypothetical protein